jgi:hypothetical protein
VLQWWWFKYGSSFVFLFQSSSNPILGRASVRKQAYDGELVNAASDLRSDRGREKRRARRKEGKREYTKIIKATSTKSEQVKCAVIGRIPKS